MDEADACAKILDQLDEELMKRMGTERLEQLQALLAEAAAALQASKLAIPAPRGRPRSRHPAPSGAVGSRRAGARDVSMRPTPDAVSSVAGPDTQKRTICTL